MRRARATPGRDDDSIHATNKTATLTRPERRKSSAVFFLALGSFFIMYFCIGYWRLDLVEDYPPTASIKWKDPSASTLLERVDDARDSAKIEQCQVLSIYPDHLNAPEKQEDKLCGCVFYPFDFAKRQVPNNYEWEKTGYNYYAAGIGLHHVTFDLQRTRHNLVYNSMMKCGSTSINRALKELAQAAQEYFPDTNMQVTYQGKQNNLLGEKSHQIMQELYQQQQSSRILPVTNTNATFQYFSTVRDPVSRFVSAIAQEMYVRRNDPKAKGFRDKCLLETPRLTLECSIKHVQERFSGMEPLDQPHFIPMTTILYKRSYGFNVNVKLFPMDQVNRIVSKMVAPSRQASFDRKKNPLKAQGSEVLKNMTVADLTESMKTKICKLYRMDVQMMKQAGFSTMCATS